MCRAHSRRSAARGPGVVTGQSDFSMKTRMLANLEQSTLYNALNFSFRFNQAYNYTATTATVNSFLCPSDGNNTGYTVATTYNGTLPYGQCNYANNIGTSRSFNGGNFDGPAWWLGATVGPRPASVQL